MTFENRVKQARRFLVRGDKVGIVMNVRGHEMRCEERARRRMGEVIEQLSEVTKIKIAPRFTGQRVTMVLASLVGGTRPFRASFSRRACSAGQSCPTC